jgi:hypothetical protein
MLACCFVVVTYLSAFPGSAAPAQKVSESFAFSGGDVVAFTGGEDVVESQRNGYFEMLSLLAFPGQDVRYRNLGWEGDTAYEQRRDLNFNSWSNQLRRVNATIVFAQFGQSESLQGKEMLPRFITAYEKLLDIFAEGKRRIVLVSPTPFERMGSLLPDVSARNDELGLYVEAIRGLAQKRGCRFMDLFTPLRKFAGREPPLTRDGLHLGSHGHWLAARETARQLGLPMPAAKVKVDPVTGALSSPRFEQLRQVILQKNQYWFDYWRPTNWAFLHGDRIEQPSSRDHRNPKIRWFPQELEEFLPLIEAKEREAKELGSRIAVTR